VMAYCPRRMAAAGLVSWGPVKKPADGTCAGGRPWSRFLLVLLVLPATAGAVVALQIRNRWRAPATRSRNWLRKAGRAGARR